LVEEFAQELGAGEFGVGDEGQLIAGVIPEFSAKHSAEQRFPRAVVSGEHRRALAGGDGVAQPGQRLLMLR